MPEDVEGSWSLWRLRRHGRHGGRRPSYGLCCGASGSIDQSASRSMHSSPLTFIDLVHSSLPPLYFVSSTRVPPRNILTLSSSCRTRLAPLDPSHTMILLFSLPWPPFVFHLRVPFSSAPFPPNTLSLSLLHTHTHVPPHQARCRQPRSSSQGDARRRSTGVEGGTTRGRTRREGSAT